MNIHPFIIIICGLLIILWTYSSVSKLTEFGKFKQAMLTQVFPRWVGHLLIYLLPVIELSLAGLLLFKETRYYGMYASFFLMLLFTLYVGGAVLHIYSKYPCACGGLFNRLGWAKHFIVNIVLTIIALIGVLLIEV